MKKNKLAGGGLRLILLAPVLAFCLLYARIGVAAEDISMGLNVSWPPDALVALAVAKGLVPSKYHVHVHIFQSPLTAYSLLAAGKLDILDSTTDYIPVAVAKKLPVVAVSLSDLSYGADQIVARPGIGSGKNLVGKRVAAPQAYLGELLMGLWLAKVDVKTNQVKWVDLNATDAVGPLITGNVAAAYLYQPWISKVLDNLKGAHVVATSSNPYYLRTGMLGDAIYMNSDFVRNHRAAAEAILKARYQALEYWHNHTAEANKFIAHFLQWPVSDVQAVMGTNGKFIKGGVYLFDFNQAARYCGVLKGSLPFGIRNGQWPESARMTNRWWIKLGLLKHMHNVSSGIDCSLIKDLIHSGYQQTMKARK